jgi:hypothetical protein
MMLMLTYEATQSIYVRYTYLSGVQQIAVKPYRAILTGFLMTKRQLINTLVKHSSG